MVSFSPVLGIFVPALLPEIQISYHSGNRTAYFRIFYKRTMAPSQHTGWYGCHSILTDWVCYQGEKLLSKLINPSALLFCSMIWLSGISFGFGWLDLVRNYFRYGVWDFLFSLSAVVVILNLSHIVNKIPFIAPPVRFVGKNSLKFLCFHTLELNLFPWEVFIHGSYANEIIFLMKITYISASTLILNNYNRLKCSMIKFQSQKSRTMRFIMNHLQHDKETS